MEDAKTQGDTGNGVPEVRGSAGEVIVMSPHAQKNQIPALRPSVVEAVASQYGMDPRRFEQTLRGTVVPANCTPEQFAAFLLVAKQYNLNPITREIYAFPAKGGGIQPLVGVDGWVKLMNEHPAFDGAVFSGDEDADGKLVSMTCSIYRKDRAHPMTVTEYLSECKRSTDPWRTTERRMLRHKALIQCVRYAFGFLGIMEPDEFERIAPAHNAPKPRETLEAFASQKDARPQAPNLGNARASDEASAGLADHGSSGASDALPSEHGEWGE